MNGKDNATIHEGVYAHSCRYGSLTSRRVDLVGDYAGQELFLVEGDSLLLHCLSDARLDFDCKDPPDI